MTFEEVNSALPGDNRLAPCMACGDPVIVPGEMYGPYIHWMCQA